MANIETLRTDGEIELINRVYGDSYIETQSFELVRSAAQGQTQRDENVCLLQQFSSFCEDHDIGWFVYGTTLQGVLSYADYLPGVFDIDLGMTRSNFVKFELAYNSLSSEEEKTMKWLYQPYFDGTSIRRIFAHLISKRSVAVMKDGKYVYDSDSRPLTAKGDIPITVFDEVPDDFFTRKKFYRQMKRRNLMFKNKIWSTNKEAYREGQYDWEDVTPSSRHRLLPLRFVSWSMHSLAQRYNGRGTHRIANVSGWRSVTLPKSDIGDTDWSVFAGIRVRCPDRPDVWAQKPIIQTTPGLKALQSAAKVIVCEIDRVCKKLGISYFACGGTMLGYVRDGGFIPWDDDIDVGMLRKDYEIFKAKASELIDSERFFLQTRETDPDIPYLFSKVRLKGSEYITEYNKFRHFNKGICVDVFPFDYIPNSVVEQSAFIEDVLVASKRHNHIVNRQYPPDQIKEYPSDIKNLDYFIAQINGKILAHHYRNKNLVETQEAYDRLATRYNDYVQELKLKYVASFVPSYTMALVSDLFPTQRVSFEEIEIEIPNNPDAFLTMQYGDYLIPPYPHQRTGHDLLLWSDVQGVGGGREQ